MKRIIIAATILFMMMIMNQNLGMADSGQQTNEFAVRSSAVKSDGSISFDFTGDGRGISMPVEWTNVPAGTKYFALSLWHIPHSFSDPTDLKPDQLKTGRLKSDQVKSYWVVYNIPADVRSLPEGANGIGTDGYNDKNKTGYDPMRSKGPGVKEYNLTVYALSVRPVFNTPKVKRSDLLKAIEGITLDECTLKYTYERGKETGQLKKKFREKRPGKMEPLTDTQKEKVKKILSDYDPASLTADDARAIHEAFRKAGLRGGPAAQGAIREAGFDPDEL